MGFLETTPILVVSGTLFLEMYNHLNPITMTIDANTMVHTINAVPLPVDECDDDDESFFRDCELDKYC